MSEQLIKQEQTVKTFFQQDSVKKKFTELVGAKSTGLITSILQITASGDLAKADPISVYNAACTAAILDLPINQNLGYAYIIGYNNKQPDGSYKVQAQFQIGYKGFKQLALRTGQFKTMNDSDVRKGEIKHFDRLTGSIEFEWVQDYSERSKLPIIGYVSSFELINGFKSTFYMTIEELNAHGLRFSKPFKKGYGLWKDDFDSMARKTVTKLNLSKNAPLSIEMQKAVLVDQGIIQDETGDKVEFADSVEFTEEIEDPNKKTAVDLINNAKTLKDLEKNEQAILQAYPDLFTDFETRRTELSK